MAISEQSQDMKLCSIEMLQPRLKYESSSLAGESSEVKSAAELSYLGAAALISNLERPSSIPRRRSFFSSRSEIVRFRQPLLELAVRRPVAFTLPHARIALSMDAFAGGSPREIYERGGEGSQAPPALLLAKARKRPSPKYFLKRSQFFAGEGKARMRTGNRTVLSVRV